ncbi:MAG: AmmeMemoRadiSam system radical SAM enzyme [Deltaproteobacteria bacterium]|nr:AmmeMemoRadiSam system radical SAM enzyme [Deltaproteobacteria bacterium]
MPGGQEEAHVKEARFYRRIEGGQVLCELCPRLCRLRDGQIGFCFVRKNIGGTLYSLAYGRPCAVQVDPIEKKPFFHVMPGTRAFSIGTAGCNMGCLFCQNWDISKARLDHVRTVDLPPEAVVEAALATGARSLAFTYNEPTIFAEYVMDTAALARGLRRLMVTNGYLTPQALPEVYRDIDAANVDLKGFSEQFYRKITLSHLEPVLATLKALRALGVWIEVTNLVIPTLNDTPEEIGALARWVRDELSVDVPLHFSAFHPDFKLLDKPPTPVATLLRARALALELGLRYVYIGNVLTRDGADTSCPVCRRVVIRRVWHRVVLNDLRDGHCPCGAVIPGLWTRRPAAAGQRS